MSSIRKITILLIISISLILIFLGSSIYYYLSNYSYADFYKRLEARVSVAEKYRFESNQKDAQILKNIREEHLELLSDEKEYILYCPNAISMKQLADTHSIPLNFLKLVYNQQFANFQKGRNRIGNRFYASGKRFYRYFITKTDSIPTF